MSIIYQKNLIPRNLGITTHTINNCNNKAHKHYHYEILYVIDGAIRQTMNGNTATLTIGDCCLLTKNDVHEIKYAEHSLHRDILISCELFDSVCSLISENAPFSAEFGIQNKLLHLSTHELLELELIANNFTNTIDITKKRGLGIELTIRLINKFINSDQDGVSKYPSIVNKILTLLNKPDALIGGIPTIVEHLNYSKPYVCYIFKKEMGINLSQYIKDVRLKYIEYYLITTDYTLQQIANLVGIESLSYFNRLFKSKHSVSPVRFRRNYRFIASTDDNSDK